MRATNTPPTARRRSQRRPPSSAARAFLRSSVTAVDWVMGWASCWDRFVASPEGAGHPKRLVVYAGRAELVSLEHPAEFQRRGTEGLDAAAAGGGAALLGFIPEWGEAPPYPSCSPPFCRTPRGYATLGAAFVPRRGRAHTFGCAPSLAQALLEHGQADRSRARRPRARGGRVSLRTAGSPPSAADRAAGHAPAQGSGRRRGRHAGDVHPGLPGSGAVRRSQRTLHLALPHRRQPLAQRPP